MSWAGYWLPNIIQWTVGPLMSVLVGLYVRRLVRLNRSEVERVVQAVEGVLGSVRVPPPGRTAHPVPFARPHRPKGPLVNLRNYRKGIAVTFGVLLIGLLTWAATDGVVAQLLTPLLPPSLRPLAGALGGGIATIAGVIIARNGEKPTTSEDDGTVAASPPEIQPATPAATPEPVVVPAVNPPAAPVATGATPAVWPPTGPFWAGVAAGEPQASTSIVHLDPVPARDYR